MLRGRLGFLEKKKYQVFTLVGLVLLTFFICVWFSLFALVDKARLGITSDFTPPAKIHVASFCKKDHRLSVAGAHPFGATELNKTKYNFWQDRCYHGDGHDYLLWRESHGNVKELNFYHLAALNLERSSIPETEVKFENFKMAQHVLRSSKTFYGDWCVIIDGIWKDFHRILDDIRGTMLSTKHIVRNTVFIVFDQEMSSSVCLKDLNVYFIGKDFWEEKDNKVQMQWALIEIADFVVTPSLDLMVRAVSMETPSLLLFESEVDLASLSKYTRVRLEEIKSQHIGIGGERKAILSLDEINELLSQQVVDGLFQKKADLIFHSYLDPTMGYGSSAEEMVLALDELGLNIRFLPRLPMKESWRSFVKKRTIDLVSNTLLSDYYIGYFVPHEAEVRYIHRYARKAKKLLLYTTFETTKVPSSWPLIINHYDKQMVSCNGIRSSFINTGVTIPVEIVPLGVDVADWPIMERDWSGVFRFALFADGSWTNHRKNYQLVYDAFVKNFRDSKNVELLIKVSNEGEHLRALMKTMPSNVRIRAGRYNQKKLLALLKSAHCFVFPSHGEGFGLPPREAMATGIPVILAGFAGLEPISSNDFNYILAWNYTKASGYDAWVDQNFNSSDFGNWASISLEEVMRAMAEAQSEPLLAKEKGLRASKYVREHETYALTARRLIEVVQNF